MFIKDIKDFKSVFGGVQRNMEWDTWKPFINEAEQFYIIPAIGDELYTELDGLVNAATPNLNTKQARLVSYLKISIAAYADYCGWFRILLGTGDGGKTIIAPKDMQAPGKWTTVGGRKDAFNRGDKSLEMALAYLENNAADFPTWKDSPFYTIIQKQFIASATELTEFFPHAAHSRRMFLQLKDYLKKAQEKHLKTVIGSEQLTAWVAKISDADSSFSPEEDEAFEMVRSYVTRKAVSDAIPYLNISEDWRLIAEFDGMQSENVLPKERREELALKESELAEGFRNELIRHLQTYASATVFPEYFSSPLYSSRLERKASSKLPNSKENKYFVL